MAEADNVGVAGEEGVDDAAFDPAPLAVHNPQSVDPLFQAGAKVLLDYRAGVLGGELMEVEGAVDRVLDRVGGVVGHRFFSRWRVAAAARTAVINKRAGGTGMISGRKAFQRPIKEGIELLNAIQDVYLEKDVTVA